MRKRLFIPLLTLLALVVIDLGAAATLWLGETSVPALRPLVNFFSYGRSVPGKLADWEAHPKRRDVLLHVAWRDDQLENSAALFAAERPAADEIMVRGYGMSFTNKMITTASEIDPRLRIDMAGGPAAPPNNGLMLFLDDRANRREGDVVVFGVLSPSLAGIAAMSNRTWMFEQPAPFTYAIFRPDDSGGLTRIDPVIGAMEEEFGPGADPERVARWRAQLAREDQLYTPEAFAAPWLDRSPLARLVRRSLATTAIADAERAVLDPDAGFPTDETLRRMIRIFAETAREDGQIPVIHLIQGNDLRDRDVYDIAAPVLEAFSIPYVATKMIQNPADPRGFLGDGHFKPPVDRRIAQVFLDVLAAAGEPHLAQATPQPATRPDASGDGR
jgi:hypothetical protein